VNTEVELKLALPASALRQAERLAWLRKLAVKPISHDRLVSDYFDTKKRKLKRLQTIKGRSGNGALGRFEREDEINSPRPRLKYARGTPFEKLVTEKLKKKLRPVFRTDVQRSVMGVHLNGSDI